MPSPRLMNQPMLEARGVLKRYGPLTALQRTDFAVGRGDVKALLGPSGSGKSTLIRVLIGLVRPDEGQVRFEGQPVTPQNLLPVRRRMGYVIQEGGLFPHLTTRENATLMARHLGWERPRIDARLDELVALTHLPPDVVDRYPVQLSGGQRQRVSLMRALMLDPDVLLFDEPLGALDPMIRAELQRDLREIFQALKKTVVLVTHDIGEAGFLADQIVMMREGGIVQEGSLEQLVRHPADEFVEQFINAQRSPLESLGPATNGAGSAEQTASAQTPGRVDPPEGGVA